MPATCARSETKGKQGMAPALNPVIASAAWRFTFTQMNLRSPVNPRARSAHKRFQRWGALQDTGTIEVTLIHRKRSSFPQGKAGKRECRISSLFEGQMLRFYTRLCRALPEHSISPQAANTNMRLLVTSLARRAHTRFQRWGASQDAGTIRRIKRG